MSQRKAKKPTPRPAAPAPAAAASPMNLEMLERLVKLMSANDVSRVDLRDGDQRVVLQRGAVAAPVQQMAYAPAPQAQQYAAAPAPAGAPAAPAAAPVDENAGLVAIKSPMVGTFYARPSPDAKNFVAVGSVVNEDTDVCIIEAMKVFNNIKAEAKGTIMKIIAEDGKPVEFGQTLFLVKP